jgi:hypothetical protein
VRHRGSTGPASGRHAWRIVLWGVGTLGLVGLVWILYLSSVHSLPPSSDGATVVLEGKAMAGGNFLLNHWGLSLDSFWLVDVPLYAIAVLIGGVHHQLLNLIPAVEGAAVVGTGAWIACRGHRRVPGVFAAGTVIMILGLPTHAFAGFYLLGPLHVATTLWCLAAFVALRRARFGWGWLAVVVLLAAGLLGDFQTLVLGVVPVGLAGIVASLRTRLWRVGAPAVSAAVASLAVAEVGRRIARVVGTFTIAPANPRAPFHQMILNIHHVVTYGAALEGVGADVFGPPTFSPVLQAAHAVGLALGVLAVGFGLMSIVRSSVTGREARASVVPPSWDSRETIWLEDAMVLGFFGGCGTFIWLSLTSSIAFGRYLTSAVIFGSILAGRLVGRIAEHADDLLPNIALSAVAVLVLAGCASSFVSSVTTASPVQPVTQLASYLEQHHLTKGIGDYWSASIVTVASADKVVVRPVSTLSGGLQIGRYLRQSSSSWYGGGFQFLVFNDVVPWDDVETQSAVSSFGGPRHVAVIGRYKVMTWAHDLTIKPDGTFATQPWATKGPAG